MRTVLYILAILLVVGWIIGAFIYVIGSIIHLLLVAAIVLIIFTYFRRRFSSSRSSTTTDGPKDTGARP
ncbi:MAG TPA: lmo0937 family membrane protein [Anditalea sp.]|nr:lmo0937 family membrane protein [Anditalea sp.]